MPTPTTPGPREHAGAPAAPWRIVMVAEDREPYRSMTELCLWSLRRRAGALAHAPATVVVNDHAGDALIERWRDRYQADVEVRPTIHGIPKTSLKFNALLADAVRPEEWLLYLDCDCVVCAPLDPIAARVEREHAADGADFFSTPTNMKQAWGLPRIFARYTGRPASSFEHLRHPWFLEGYPVFNTGVFVLRGAHAARLYDEVVPLCTLLRQRGRATSPNPLHWLKVKWNRKVWKRPDADRWVIPPWHPANHAGQIAMPIALLRLGVGMGVLPHSANWRLPGMNQGEDDPIRILHYCGHHRFDFDRAQVLTGAHIGAYLTSDNPGRRALAEAVRAYHADAG